MMIGLIETWCWRKCLTGAVLDGICSVVYVFLCTQWDG